MGVEGEDQQGQELRLEEKIYWRALASKLPRGGVRRFFPTEEACRNRLIHVRWPEGPICPACRSKDVFELSSRPLFKCRGCKVQFSATSGTSLHNSHAAIQLWFLAAELVIREHVDVYCKYHVPTQILAESLGLSYRSAFRMRRIIVEDLSESGDGLLRASVCMETFSQT